MSNIERIVTGIALYGTLRSQPVYVIHINLQGSNYQFSIPIIGKGGVGIILRAVALIEWAAIERHYIRNEVTLLPMSPSHDYFRRVFSEEVIELLDFFKDGVPYIHLTRSEGRLDGN